MLRLYYTDVSAIRDDGEGYALSEYRREKLSKQRLPESRRQSVGAELMLQKALYDFDPRLPWPPEIMVNTYGKPEWKLEGLYFSCSHSGRIAACALSDRPVGLDVQELTDCRDSLVCRFFAPEERALIARSTDRDRDFTRIWTLKESWIKAIGTGLSTPLESFSVVGETRPDAAFWHTERDGYHFAVCVPGAESAEPEIHSLTTGH